MLVDATACYSIFSFMHGSTTIIRYRWTFIVENTTFWTSTDNFDYTIMMFGLRNVDAAYQRAITTIFLDILHDWVEAYMDDIVVKSKEEIWSSLQIIHLQTKSSPDANNTFADKSLKCFGCLFKKILGVHCPHEGDQPRSFQCQGHQRYGAPYNL